jgi:ribonuclease PH
MASSPIREAIAAVSVGISGGQPLLDLCYKEDVAADVDMNVAMTSGGRFVEVQGTGEDATFARKDLDRLLDLGVKGIRKLLAEQKKALGAPLRRRG